MVLCAWCNRMLLFMVFVLEGMVSSAWADEVYFVNGDSWMAPSKYGHWGRSVRPAFYFLCPYQPLLESYCTQSNHPGLRMSVLILDPLS